VLGDRTEADARINALAVESQIVIDPTEFRFEQLILNRHRETSLNRRGRRRMKISPASRRVRTIGIQRDRRRPVAPDS
jgi:hypothetical protein